MRGPTLLKRYLKDTHQRARDFARASGISEAQISRWLSGARRPGLYYAERLEKLTDAAIPARAWATRPKTRTH